MRRNNSLSSLLDLRVRLFDDFFKKCSPFPFTFRMEIRESEKGD